MDILIQILLTFLIGVLASFIGAISGGGGLISIPFLIFLGLPPTTAVATNKFGAVGLSIGSIYKFWKDKKIEWKFALMFVPLAVLGGVIGAKLLLEVNEEFLSLFIGVLILVLLGVMFFKKEVGLKKREMSKAHKGVGIFIYFLLMILGGFFGGGIGVLIIYTLTYFMGFTMVEANATDMVPWFVLSLSALIIFMVSGIVDYTIGITLFFGMILGGYIGARTAIKKGNIWVKYFFACVVIASSIKLLFF